MFQTFGRHAGRNSIRRNYGTQPTNILIASSGVSKLVDFGLAEISTMGGSVQLQKQSEKDDDVAVDRTGQARKAWHLYC